MSAADATLFNFPCAFPVRKIGWYAYDFDARVVGIIRKYAPDLADTGIEKRHRHGARHVPVSVTLRAQSREQLDNISHELKTNRRILFAP